ncbi:MAG: phosphate propanoyltransferase [Sporomusaceae bacterium]|nr:phosphate propanoyltransferase [Sporomusaceae bacterium]
MDSKQLANVITEAVMKRLQQDGQAPLPVRTATSIPVGISNRHVHLALADMLVLFGSDRLTLCKDLSQPGQFACQEKLLVAGPKGAISDVRVLGPLRAKTQVELAPSDCVRLGIKAPVRDSGDLEDSAPLTLVGPTGTVTVKEGAIVAARHIHMQPADAGVFGCRDGERVSVRTGGSRGLVFNEVLVRVSDMFRLELHLDLDEANAAGLRNGDTVELMKESC